MKSLMGTLLFSLGLIYFLYIDFFVWLKPKHYIKNVHERRLRLKSQFPFLPNWFVGFIFFYEQTQLSVWWARIIGLLATLICIGGLIAAIHGPF
jgi:hypothetical protein